MPISDPFMAFPITPWMLRFRVEHGGSRGGTRIFRSIRRVHLFLDAVVAQHLGSSIGEPKKG